MSQQPPVEQATAAPGEQRNLRRPGEVRGLPDEIGETRPLPNRTDAAFEELQHLQEEARGLGLEVTGREPLGELRAQVEQAKAERG